MLELADVSGILRLLERLLTFGRSDIVQVESETDELIRDLSKSLVSLHDVVTQVTRLKPEEFNETAFGEICDYFKRFYLYPEDMDKARTHCSTLKRDVGRITYKLAQFLRTDIGQWEEVSRNIQSEQDLDQSMTKAYDASIEKLNEKLNEIQNNLANGDVATALDLYKRLKADLSADIGELRTGIETMKRVAVRIREVCG